MSNVNLDIDSAIKKAETELENMFNEEERAIYIIRRDMIMDVHSKIESAKEQMEIAQREKEKAQRENEEAQRRIAELEALVKNQNV